MTYYLLYMMEEEEEEIYISYQMCMKGAQTKSHKIEGYVERIVPSLTALEFKSHFR